MIFNLTNLKLLIVLLLLFFNILAFWAWIGLSSQDDLRVVFLDVGQGDGVLIKASNGNKVLIDAGPGSNILPAISDFLPFYDRSIDLAIGTHPDFDHTGGFIPLFEKYNIPAYLTIDMETDKAYVQELNRLIKEQEVEKFYAQRSAKINMGDGVYLEILFPDRDISDISENDASLVAQLRYGQNSFLFTGDSTKNIERYLVDLDGPRLKSDVLKVGHHGSNTSTSSIFVETVDPEYSIISAGEDNQYGHPHPEVVDTLNSFETKILKTYQSGNIIFESDGYNLKNPKK